MTNQSIPEPICKIKECNCCKIKRSVDEFHRDRSKSDGLATLCKECKRIHKKIYKATDRFKELKRESGKRHYQKHREKLLEYRKQYYQKNSEDWNRRFKKAYYNNKEEYAERARIDREKFPGRHRAITAKYRASKLQATPLWADLTKIKEIYDKATSMNGMEVDHIVPLQSDLVCGLHCEKNLQIIPMAKNRSKRNNFRPLIMSEENEKISNKYFN